MILVDDYRLPKRVGHCRPARWSHLTASTKEELLAFAAQLGLKHAWFQDKGDGRWHFDVTDTVRRRAIVLGAKAVSIRELSAFIVARRSTEV